MWETKNLARDLLVQAGQCTQHGAQLQILVVDTSFALRHQRCKMNRAYGYRGRLKGWVLPLTLSCCIGVTDAAGSSQVFNLGSELNAQQYTAVSTVDNGT